MQTNKQKISIIMPVYNTCKYLNDSITSILNQRFQDFELIIIDDGSTDESLDIITSYDDKRIRLIKNGSNIGIAESLNIGISQAKYHLIARMDGDDISDPERLGLQLQFMTSHPEIALSGTDTKIIDAEGQVCNFRNCKVGDIAIKIALFFGETSIAHPTAIIRKQFLEERKLLYNPSYVYAEDYELWCRCSLFTEVGNLSDPLVSYRVHPKSVSIHFSETQRISARRALMKHLMALGVDYTSEEIECHFQFSLPMNEFLDDEFLSRIKIWKHKLIKLNHANKWFDDDLFQKEIEERYKIVLEQAYKKGEKK